MSEISCLSVGPLATNCYLLSGNDGILYIIDPGNDAEEIAELARSRYTFDRVEVLLTHAHVDHISGLGALMKLLPVSKVYLHAKDRKLYESPMNELLPVMAAAADLPEVTDEVGAEEFEILETPGHTQGGVCFYFKDRNALFSGDTLFAGAVGRTDFPGGNHGQLMDSIEKIVLTLPNEVEVYPGHGPKTTIGYERRTNPWIG